MNGFITKIDYSNNRQIKQNIYTSTDLSGATVFGVTFSALTTGPDPSNSGYTAIPNVYFTYSGNSAVTVYTFASPYTTMLEYGASFFSAVTSGTYATNQVTGLIFSADSTTVVDGNTINTHYTGISFTMGIDSITGIGVTFSGSGTTYQTQLLSATSLAHTGRTIWNDVKGITRTEKLIVTNNPTIGYVLTCMDSEGMTSWGPGGGASVGLWTAGSAANSVVLSGSNPNGTQGWNSVTEGIENSAKGIYSHAEGSATTAGDFSHSEGINCYANSYAGHAEGYYTESDALGEYCHTEGEYTYAKGRAAHAEGSNTYAEGKAAHSEGSETTAIGTGAHAGGFNSHALASNSFTHGDGVTADTAAYSSAILGGAANFIGSSAAYSAIIGGNSNVVDVNVMDSVILGGTGITAITNETTYVPFLNVKYGIVVGKEASYPIDIISSAGTPFSRFYMNDNGNNPFISLSGSYDSFTQIGVSTYGNPSLSFGVRATGSPSVTYYRYGQPGDGNIYCSQKANGLWIMKNKGTNTPDYIKIMAGDDATNTTPHIFINGTGGTQGYVGFSLSDSPTENVDIAGNARVRGITANASAGALHYDANGVLTTNTSDARLKTNVVTINNALDKVKNLRGVYYNWNENPTGATRIGVIAQEIENFVPELTFVNQNSPDKYMGVHYDNIPALLIEAIKELSTGNTNNTVFETQTVVAEDNNIELNYGGTHTTAIGGGITLLNGVDNNINSTIITDASGCWNINPSVRIPNLIISQNYTPTSSNDTEGETGKVTWDDNYMYIKTNNGWKRANLEAF